MKKIGIAVYACMLALQLNGMDKETNQRVVYNPTRNSIVAYSESVTAYATIRTTIAKSLMTGDFCSSTQYFSRSDERGIMATELISDDPEVIAKLKQRIHTFESNMKMIDR